jgi:hypothetical protein
MATRYFALVLGIAFLLVGIMGFIPALLMQPAGMHEHDLTVTGPGHGYLLGLFHVNVLHNIVHLLFGVWGIFAYASFDASRIYARVVAISYALLTIMGLIPALNTVFGLVPIHGHDVWLHAVIALAAAYFGWATVPAPRAVTDTGAGPEI